MTPCIHQYSCTSPAAIPHPGGELTPALYRELRRIASRYLGRERPNHTLQPTALVHEAYVKLAGVRQREYVDDVHFLAVASRAMRQVLVDHARSRAAHKRLGDAAGAPLWRAAVGTNGDAGPEFAGLIALDNALALLAVENNTLARLVEMRYFGGMTAEESAEALGMSVHVVRHDLRFAHAWLRRKMHS